MAVQVTMYLTEGDSWHHRPLHLEILKYLCEESVAGAVVFHSVAGFLGRNKVGTAHLVEAGGDLPVVVTFVDTDEHVSRVLPKLHEMAAHRLIVREKCCSRTGQSVRRIRYRLVLPRGMPSESMAVVPLLDFVYLAGVTAANPTILDESPATAVM
jgi:PII-like signaling protein